MCVCVCVCVQGVGGATAAAHALSLPADAYGNDVSDVCTPSVFISDFYTVNH